MHCPILTELPPPPAGKVGWPWTESTLPMLDTQSDGLTWPRMSIVTPSYNQGQFIEETIRSVLLQGYPNLEYIIIDGGSTDQSVEIIRKYASYISYWVSEPDRGQAHALNKGVEQATGDIFAFINSDDLLAANALIKAANFFRSHPTNSVLYGGHIEIDQNWQVLREFAELPALSWEDLVLARTYQPQPGTFWRMSAFETAGKFREDLHYFFDQEFFIRLLMHHEMVTQSGVSAFARIHGAAKGQAAKYTLGHNQEKYEVLRQFLPKVQRKWLPKLLAARFIRLSYLSTLIACNQFTRSRQLTLLLTHPILWTSPLLLKKLFNSPSNDANPN